MVHVFLVNQNANLFYSSQLCVVFVWLAVTIQYKGDYWGSGAGGTGHTWKRRYTFIESGFKMFFLTD